MANFKDAKSDSSTDNKSRSRWETMDLDNLQNIEIEIEGEDQTLDTSKEPLYEIEDEQVQEEVVKPVEPIKEDASTDNVLDNSERVQSRSEQRIRELARQKKELDNENTILREQLLASQKDRTDKQIGEVETRKEEKKNLLSAYEKEYESAVLNGDVKGQASITGKMTKANVELMALESFKPHREEVQTPVRNRQYATARDAVLDKLPEAGKQWADKNSWFVTNQSLTQQALGIASEVEQEGYSPDEPDYYKEVDKKLAEMYPQRFGKKEVPKKEEVAPVLEEKPKQSPVAKSARTSPTQKAGTVRLTREDVELAKKWRIPLEQMAHEKRKLEQAEKSGSKTTIID